MPSELDTASAAPLYQQVMDDIIRDIDSGFYGAGERIPSEEDLRDIYGVSRVTVRRSVEELAKRGYLIKRQGKGTFVHKKTSGESVFRNVDIIESFTNTCRENGSKPGARPVSCSFVSIPNEYCEFFGQSAGSKALRIVRVRTADGTPIMLEDNLFEATRYGFLDEVDLHDNSIFALIEERTGKVPTSSFGGCDLNIARASVEVASLLEVPTNEPLFYVEGRYEDQDGAPMFLGKQYMVGKRYSFRL